LTLAGEARAGAPAAVALDATSAVRISTGAALPDGAVAVVRLERASEHDGAVTLAEEATPGLNVRYPGEDMRSGQVVLGAGTRLGPAELAVAVGAGHGTVECARGPRVAVVVTGDELREPGAPLASGQIHDTNTIALTALARESGASVIAAERVGDDAGLTRTAIARALDSADLLTIVGGVSVGPHDHVKAALAELGVEERFWGVRIRPGRPAWFGTYAATLVFGLPGNPVSAVVTFLLLARPALAALQGASPTQARLRASLVEPLRRNPERTDAIRVRLRWRHDGALEAMPTGPQGSHITTSLLGADGLALVPPGNGELAAGSEVEVERL
jgi:molybdopterin molybdotransferase